MDKGQLTKLGQNLGITSPDFASCVANGIYNQQLQAELNRVVNTDSLRSTLSNGQRGFVTPTVMAGDKIIDTDDLEWLSKLTSAS